jgi:adenylate cyclase
MAWSLLASLILEKLLPWSGLAASFVLIGGELGLSLTAFSAARTWIPWVSPALGMGSVYVAMVAIRWRKAEKDKTFIRNAFQHYVHPTVVQQIIANPAKLRLGGESLESTILFSDLQGFTPFAERLSPENLVAVLNEYFSAMIEVILAHRGMLNQTLGDGILALWGVPVPDPDHPLNCCRAALAMQRRLAELNAGWTANGHPPLRMRIGIQTGKIVAGNIGSAQRFNYVPIGDNVNLASRLEQINKLYHTATIIGEDCARRVENALALREIDRIRVVGRGQPVMIYECAGERGQISEAQAAGFEQFKIGLQMFRQRNWCEAQRQFDRTLAILPNDGPSLVYIERCRRFLVEPPPPDWDGVYSALGKGG